MEFFLPVAQVQVSISIILILSLIIGFISGLFGIGGGFLMTPVLIFLGIPPAFAVANEANNILGTSVSGALTHWFRRTLDYKMGLIIVFGGVFGTIVGMIIFSYLKQKGIVNVIISLAYIYMLVMIGTLMFAKGYKELSELKKKVVIKKKIHDHYWIHGLPLRVRFHKSKLYESAIVPFMLGFIVGIFASIMGVGGAFLMVPAMIYIIGMPTKLVPGTSLFVTIFISAIVTILHAFNYGSIDLTLVVPLILGSILGVQLGQKLGQYLDSSHLKTLFALLLCAVAIAIAYDSFFRDKTNEAVNNQVVNTDLNFFSEFTLNFSNESPLLYGAFAILLAIALGALAAWMIKFMSPVIKRLLSDFRDKDKIKKEEVKFPEK